jgi:hypothetical protein
MRLPEAEMGGIARECAQWRGKFAGEPHARWVCGRLADPLSALQ